MVNISIPELEKSLLDPEFIKKVSSLCNKTKKLLKHNAKFKVKSWLGKGDLEFSDYRSYVPGDDLRRVDWNIYRRLNEIVIREYDTEAPKHLVIALDISQSMGFYKKFIYARAIAATLAYIGLSLLDRVTLFCFPQQEKLVINTHQGRHNILPIFEFLEAQQPEAQGTIESTFRKVHTFLPRHTNIIILGDFYGDYFAAIPFLSKRGSYCTAVQIVTQEERHPDLKGIFHLQDAESSKKQLLRIDKSRIKYYQQQFQRHLAATKSFCNYHKMNYLLLEPEPQLTSVLPILRHVGIIK